MRWTDIKLRNRAVDPLGIQCIALIEGQETNRCFTNSREQHEIGPVREPGPSSCCGVLLMKIEGFFFHRRHDFVEQLSDHWSDDICVFWQSRSNPDDHRTFLPLSRFHVNSHFADKRSEVLASQIEISNPFQFGPAWSTIKHAG